MAKNRIINTKFWTDGYVLDELNPIDKLLFLYLITNPYTNICGVYELPLKMMAVETGIDRENIEKVILPRFEKDGKILYRNGWVAIKNFQKHQNQNSPKIQKGIEEAIKNAPHELKEFVEGKGMYTLSHSNSNIKSNFNSNPKATAKAGDTQKIDVQAQVISLFKEINPSYQVHFSRKSQRDAAQRLFDLHGLEKLQGVIGYIKANANERYLPVITTPCQLEEKWSALTMYAQKENKKQNNFVM